MESRNESRSLADRLDRLEKQNRKLRMAIFAALITVVSAGLVGFTAVQEQLLWARQFVLVDANETKRAELIIDEGAPVLRFYDAEGKARTEVGLTENGFGKVRLQDAQGTSRISLGQTNSGGVLSLNAQNGTRIAGFGTTSAGRPIIHLNDAEGTSRFATYVGDNGAYTGLYNAQGGPVQALETLADGSPMFTLYDKGGSIRTLIGFAGEWTSPVINLRDGQGTATMMIETGGVYLNDAQGNSRTRLVGGDSPGLTIRAADGSVVWQSGSAAAGGSPEQ